ncbi:MAG: sensor histidine kinase [Bacteroidetes bacterium]|nr:sensor histidine kinase [Bacteroidota bacterium]
MKKIATIFFLVFFAKKAWCQTSKYLFNIDSAITYYKIKYNNAIAKKDATQIFNNGIKLISNYLNVPDYTAAKKQIAFLKTITKNKNSDNYFILLSSIADVEKLELNYQVALNDYLKAYNYFEKSGNLNLFFKSSVDLAEFFRRTTNFPNATEYIIKAQRIFDKNKITDTAQIIRFYNRYAAIYSEKGLHDSSLIFSKKGLALALKTNNYYSIGVAYNEIGFSYKNLKNTDSSIKYLKISEQLFNNIGAKRESVSAAINFLLAETHSKNKPFYLKQSIKKAEFLITTIKKENLKIQFSVLYFLIMANYQVLGDSLNYYKYKSICFNIKEDELLRENAAKINEIQEKYENEKLTKEIEATKNRFEFEIEKSKSQKKQFFLVLISLVALLLLLGIIFYLYFQKRKAYKLLSEKNKFLQSLIQEIHHRVKNNLQFISSLIGMQSRALDSEKEIKVLSETLRRIEAMALVHEMLYTKNNEGFIIINAYLHQLVNSILKMHNISSSTIKFQINNASFKLSPSQAIALGMICSELISNSVKYAFQNNSNFEILIQFNKNTEGSYEFLYEDNGENFSAKNDSENKLGLRLIDIFSRQLKGNYNIKKQRGFYFNLIFEPENAKH